jgi:hypothetical protein
MRPRAILGLATFLLSLLAGGACTRGSARAPAPGVTAAARVYRDPVTGRFGPPPDGAPAGASAPSALSTSTAGLTEIASPGGGRMVRLQGRFRNLLHATRAADGAVTSACVHGEPQAEPEGQDRR